MNWFWKTLKGYTVVYATVDKSIIFTHRPFRMPTIRAEKTKIGGMECKGIIIDELEESQCTNTMN